MGSTTPLIPESERLVTIQLDIPGYKPTAGILRIPIGSSAVELKQIIPEAHNLLAEMFMGLQKNDD